MIHQHQRWYRKRTPTSRYDEIRERERTLRQVELSRDILNLETANLLPREGFYIEVYRRTIDIDILSTGCHIMHLDVSHINAIARVETRELLYRDPRIRNIRLSNIE